MKRSCLFKEVFKEKNKPVPSSRCLREAAEDGLFERTLLSGLSTSWRASEEPTLLYALGTVVLLRHRVLMSLILLGMRLELETHLKVVAHRWCLRHRRECREKREALEQQNNHRLGEQRRSSASVRKAHSELRAASKEAPSGDNCQLSASPGELSFKCSLPKAAIDDQLIEAYQSPVPLPSFEASL